MSESFKVLIVGGSIAGLTLAHCLEKLGIAYEVLEQGADIAPQVGASVGILPNGALVLDQLDLFSAVEKIIEPLTFARIRYPDGFFFESQYPTALRNHFGYPLSFLERRNLLTILYDRLNDKKSVHCGKKVVRIEDQGNRAVAFTADVTEHWGHLVVGADGVHGIVRSEMWRQAEASAETVLLAEKTSLRVDYACIFGISSAVPGLVDGLQLSLLGHDLTIHVFRGQDGKAFWFINVKLEKTCSYANRPRLLPEDGRRICETLLSEKINTDLEFRTLWERCDVYTITPLEEGYFKSWNRGRLVCVGDAVRKITPNMGQGANMAIEDVAVLANVLWKADLATTMQSSTAMEGQMRIVCATRLARTAAVCRQSELFTRLQAGDGLFKRFFARYVLSAFVDMPAGSAAAALRGGQKLAFVEVPQRATPSKSWWTLISVIISLMPRTHVLAIFGAAAMATRWALRG